MAKADVPCTLAPAAFAALQIVAAQGEQFTSVFDSRVVYQLQQWIYARCGCSSGVAWPPLWSCMYAFPTAQQVSSMQGLAAMPVMRTSVRCGCIPLIGLLNQAIPAAQLNLTPTAGQPCQQQQCC